MIGFFYLAIGISLLYFSGDWLVDGSTSLARHMKVKPFIIALTLVAFGTSAPELGISVHSAIKGYEGGQMPIYMRLPNRGFNVPNPKKYALINLGILQKFIERFSIERERKNLF